jgi:hypothetical protein
VPPAAQMLPDYSIGAHGICTEKLLQAHSGDGMHSVPQLTLQVAAKTGTIETGTIENCLTGST